MKNKYAIAGLGMLLAVSACSQPADEPVVDDTATTEAAAADQVATDTAVEGDAATAEAPAADAAKVEGTLAAAREVPTGTYTKSCSNVTLDGVKLTGTCQTSEGDSKTSTLDLTDCPVGHNVMNDEGTLVCREG